MTVDRKPRIGWKVIVVLTLGASAFAIAPYVLMDPEQSRVSLDAAFPLHYPLLLIHIFSSFVALLIGWLQFLPNLRATRSRVHRLIGRFYLGLVAIGGSTGIIVGMYTESYIRQLAFLTLVVLWIFTGWKGYQTARQKRFDSHRIWMIRNYSVTLVAASARIVTPLCILIYLAGHRDMPFQGIEPILRQILEVNIWVGLVINIIIVEWMIVHRDPKRSDPNKNK